MIAPPVDCVGRLARDLCAQRRGLALVLLYRSRAGAAKKEKGSRPYARVRLNLSWNVNEVSDGRIG